MNGDTTAGAALQVAGLVKRYGEFLAVDEVSLTVPRGAVYGFLGPNGAGKTTTIRSIMGITLPDAGTIRLAGHPLDRNALDRVGYLPEERGLYRKMRCDDQLVFFGELKGVPPAEGRRRAAAWLERLGLADHLHAKVDSLSKGMQQKVQFAATFLPEPDLVILDEPFSGLDPLNIELLRGIIQEEHARGCTIIFSTHMLAEAEKICSHICLIDGGRKILDGSLAEVRRAFPQRVVQVAYADDREPPADLPGVEHRRRDEGVWKLTVDGATDPGALLAPLAAAGPLTLFSAGRPTLEEIFLSAVRRRRERAAAPDAAAGEVAS